MTNETADLKMATPLKMDECPCYICKECRAECDHCGCYLILVEKLDLLKQYISKQAENESLWFIADNMPEAYLQQELRRVAWLIEDATPEQIKHEIGRMQYE